jgi:hypothetical protein
MSIDTALLHALMNMQIEPAGAALSFEARLARENSWSINFANRVMHEYRRFLYLAATSAQPVTPSDEVDQAWHLHLTYSRHYWDVLCRQILRTPLHHGPTAGGATEGARYANQYETTLALYRTTFGKNPPADIWPDAKKRFAANYRRVETGKHWVVPKTAGYAGVAAMALAGCSQSGGNPLLVIGLIGGIIIGSYLMVRFGRPDSGKKRDGSGCGSGCGSFGGGDSGGDSGCGGGCGGD